MPGCHDIPACLRGLAADHAGPGTAGLLAAYHAGVRATGGLAADRAAMPAGTVTGPAPSMLLDATFVPPSDARWTV